MFDLGRTLLAAAAPEDFAVGSTLISIDASSSQAFWASSYLNPSAELTLTFASATSVPLPAAAPLMAAGLAGLALIARRRRG